MKNLLKYAAVLLLSACSKPESSSAAIESVETLVANPDRLNDLRAQCKADHARIGDAQCNAVAEATRRRFMKSGMSPTPNPAPSASSTSAVPSPPPIP